MTQHRLPFDNRWTNGVHAWEWHCELERIGLDNVRAMFVNHETEHTDQPLGVADVPAEFVRDWLSFHDRRAARQQVLWRGIMIALAAVAAGASLFAVLR